jgi:hypothetical protein
MMPNPETGRDPECDQEADKPGYELEQLRWEFCRGCDLRQSDVHCEQSHREREDCVAEEVQTFNSESAKEKSVFRSRHATHLNVTSDRASVQLNAFRERPAELDLQAKWLALFSSSARISVC